MKNDSVRGNRKISIPPTVLFSTIGVMEDVRRAVTMYFKAPGDPVYVVGITKNELGASEYYRMLAREQGTPESCGGEVPRLDVRGAMSIYRIMGEATANGVLRSSHTPTLGGLAVAFALASLGGNLGAEINLSSLICDGNLDDDARLFSESNSRFVITCAPDRKSDLESLFRGLPCACVGTVTDTQRLRIMNTGGRTLVDAETETLRRSFKETLYGI
jgi:phosphoribosylformylglycinamidine (FGAM) synthase-like enzyme